MDEFFKYLNHIANRGIKPGLERIRAALEKLGNPHEGLKVIHIAGTNGKGSACSLLAQILSVSGYKVGLTLSPHLQDYRERIQFSDFSHQDFFLKKISERDLLELHGELHRFEDLTYFEYGILLALMAFVQGKVDFAVLETGMGGRLDATNICASLLSGVTTIGLDHQKQLGDTELEILSEKIQIAKKGSEFLFGPCEDVLMNYAKNYCEEKGIHFWSVMDFPRVQISLPKPPCYHENLHFALSLAKILERKGYQIDFEKFLKLEKYFPPARYEILQENPKTILDGAHNEQALKILKGHLEKTENDDYDLFFGCTSDREVEELAPLVLPGTGEIFWMCFEAEDRSPTLDFYKTVQSKYGGEILSVNSDFKHKLAQGNRTKIICGSLFLCGEVKRFFTPVNQRVFRYQRATNV